MREAIEATGQREVVAAGSVDEARQVMIAVGHQVHFVADAATGEGL